MDNDTNVLISLEIREDEDKTAETCEPDEINTTQIEEPYTVVSLALDENGGPGESSTDPPMISEHTQQAAAPTDQPDTSSTPESNPPEYTSWQCVDAYRPRPEANTPSDRPPIPRGIPPPPYHAFHLGPVPPAELQSLSDEPPPEYPGPPGVFNPSQPSPPQYPAGSRLAQAAELERRREIGRLLVLSAVVNACDERSRRNPSSAQRPTPGRLVQCSDVAARSRKARLYGSILALGVLVLVFTVIGVAVRMRTSSDYDDVYSSNYNSDDNYKHYNKKTTTTEAPPVTCSLFYCQNGGRCDDTRFMEPRCLCPSAYYGTRCQYNKYDTIWRQYLSTTRRPYGVIECSYSYCENGGSCIETSVGSHCSCPYNYGGLHCQHKITDYETTTSSAASSLHEQCSEYWCLNGGTCWFSALSGRNCDCKPGYGGYRCLEVQ